MDDENPSRLLVVEGYDDKHVVSHLLKKSNSLLNFNIRSVDGYDNLLQAISPMVKASGRERLGFVLDADDDLDGHWISVREKLRQAELIPPDQLDGNGCIFSSGMTVGVWIMPDNLSTGELENFIIEMVPDLDPTWPLAKQFIDAIPENDRKFRNDKVDKAKLHAWLSSRKAPGKMGAAIGAGDLELSNQLTKRFFGWLEKLFA